jgi:hypothetical protein
MKLLPPKISVGVRVLSWGLKWTGHEADHSPPSIGKVKNYLSYTSDPSNSFKV